MSHPPKGKAIVKCWALKYRKGGQLVATQAASQGFCPGVYMSKEAAKKSAKDERLYEKGAVRVVRNALTISWDTEGKT